MLCATQERAVVADALVVRDVRDVVVVLEVVDFALSVRDVRDVVVVLVVVAVALSVTAADAAVRAATAAAYLLYLSNMVRSSARGSTHSISISRYNASLAALNL